jgi:UDP-N-acetyl-D-glucosamine dehydrogenase
MSEVRTGSATAQIAESIETSAETLAQRLQERAATIGIIGLGYVGLPLAVACGNAYNHTIGFDVNAKLVEGINAGRSHIQDIADSDVMSLVTNEKISCTSDFSRLCDCDVIVVCVPTPLTGKDPDLSYVNGAAKSIAANLRPGQLVILESTTFPGTTDELLLPLFEQNGLALDRDFFLAFSPERVDPGSNFPMREIPKVVGGCSATSTQLACAFYSAVVDVIHPVSNARAAETVKLLENTFRLINIGLINEFAILCNHLGIDSDEVINAAATKPFGFMPFFPGPGAGGHCIPLDPLYLNWKAKQQGAASRFIDLADDINTKMPAYIVDLITRALNDRAKALRNARILVVGVAYKDNVADTRQSPAIAIIDRLRFSGAIIAYHDPLVPLLNFDLHGWNEWRPRFNITVENRALRVAGHNNQPRRRRYDVLHSVTLDASAIESADCVLILSKLRDVDYALIADHANLIVDTRHALTSEQLSHTKGKVVHL